MSDRDEQPADLEQTEERMDALLEGYRHSPTTERKCALHWTRFVAWRHENDRLLLPAEDQTVAACLAEEAPGRYGEGTMGVILAAIGDRHRWAGHLPPGRAFTKETQAGIARDHPPGPGPWHPGVRSPAPPPGAQGIRQLTGASSCRSPRPVPRAGPLRPGRSRSPPPVTTCARSAFADVLATTSADRPLDDPSVRARVRIAAGHAGVALSLDASPGAGLAPKDPWRVWARVSRSAAHFIRDRAYAMLVRCGPFQPSEPLRLRGRDTVEHPHGLVVHLP